MQVNAKQPDGLRLLAKIYSGLNRFPEAEECLHKALEMEPNNAQSHAYLAIILKAQKKYEKALLHFQKAYQLNPQITEAKKQALALQKQIQVTNQINLLEQSLRKNPQDSALHVEIGGLYFGLKDYENAVYHWEKALESEPEQAAVLNNLAWIMATQEASPVYDPNQAVTYALQACELKDFQRPDILDTLMSAYAAAGDFQSAIETGKKALALLDPQEDSELEKKINGDLETYKKKAENPKSESPSKP